MSSVLLHEDPIADRIVVLSGGDAKGSVNRKTGKMLQLSVLVRSQNPVEAVQTGTDEKVCGSCSLRGSLGSRPCYVNVARGPKRQWLRYQAGRMKRATADVFHRIRSRRRAIRFGSYGDPGLLPIHVIQHALAFSNGGWTGYTQLWRTTDTHRSFFMASVQSNGERQFAKAKGWRTFRILARWEKPAPGEVLCPASEEAGKKTTCAECLLCDGKSGPDDQRSDVAVYVHGELRGVREFERSRSPMLVRIQGVQE